MEIILAALLGAAIYRLRGWGPPAPERWWKRRPILQAAFASAYGVVAFHAAPAGWPAACVELLVLGVTTFCVNTGHASLTDLGGAIVLPADGQSDEWYSGWIPWPGTYVHDFLGLMVSGVLISAPCGLVVAFGGHVGQGAAILASGALKAPAYAIGRFAPLNDKLKVSEPLCGAFLWGSLVWIATGG